MHMHIPPEIATIKPMLAFWNFLIPAAAGLIGSLFGHKKKSDTSSGTPQDARLQTLLPLLMPLLQQSQQASAQNYQMQMDRYQQADPLRMQLLQMSQGLMPRSAQPVQPLPLPTIKTKPGVQ